MTPAAGFTQPEEDRTASAAALVRSPAAAKASVLKPNHIRSLALAGAVVGVALLPIAAAQATPPQSSQTQTTASGQSGSALGQSGSSNTSAGTAGSAAGSASGATAVAQSLGGEYCSANDRESLSGDGAVQVQVCVEQLNGTVFAQAYVANDGTVPQIVAVDLSRTDGTLVQAQCVVPAATASALCGTSPIPASQGSGAYDSVAESAGQGKPLSDGAVHVESGLVAPVPAAAASSSPSSSNS